MSEEWIDTLAKRIIAVDLPLELEIKIRDHRIAEIAKQSHGYFKTFAHFVKLYSEQMHETLTAGGIESIQTCTYQETVIRFPSNGRDCRLSP